MFRRGSVELSLVVLRSCQGISVASEIPCKNISSNLLEGVQAIQAFKGVISSLSCCISEGGALLHLGLNLVRDLVWAFGSFLGSVLGVFPFV